MDLQVPESERRWLHAVLVLGTLVLALILVSQVSVILVFFSDVLLIMLLAWLLAFILSPIVALVLRAFPKLPRVAVVAGIYAGLFVVLSWIVLVVAGSLANSIGNFIAELPDAAVAAARDPCRRSSRAAEPRLPGRSRGSCPGLLRPTGRPW